MGEAPIVYSVVDLVSGADANTPNAAGFSVTTPVKGFGACQSFSILGNFVGATGGTLDIIIEQSPDGVDWYEMIHFTQLAAGAAAGSQWASKPQANTVVTAVGKNLTTTMVLAAGGVAIAPPFFNQWRVRYVAGAGTSAGATGIQLKVIKWNVFY